MKLNSVWPDLWGFFWQRLCNFQRYGVAPFWFRPCMYSNLFKSLKKYSVSSQSELWRYQYILARVTKYLKRSPGLEYHECWNFSQLLCRTLAWQVLCLAWKEGSKCWPQPPLQGKALPTQSSREVNVVFHSPRDEPHAWSNFQVQGVRLLLEKNRIVTSIYVHSVYMYTSTSGKRLCTQTLILLVSHCSLKSPF